MAFGKWEKRGIILISDICMTLIALRGADWLSASTAAYSMNAESTCIIIMIQAISYGLCGLYRGVWRFASIPDLIRIMRAIVLGILATIGFIQMKSIYLTMQFYAGYTLLLILLLCAPRLFYRWYREYRKQTSQQGKRVLVVGAGNAGEGIIRDLRRYPLNKNFLPVAFVDDDHTRSGCEVQGVRILGMCEDICTLVKNLRIDLILIAIPSASSMRMRDIVNYCEQSKVTFRTLPGIKDIADGVVSIHSLREVLLEDLLGRDEVQLDWEVIKDSIFAKTILVTGAGGSIGSELCRQISRLFPEKLIIIDKNEFNLYAIDKELQEFSDPQKIFSHLCCVTDQIEMTKIFQLYQPDLVFHVAAYKHVPLLENHLRISMHNNIIGTRVVATLAHQYNVDTFVLISTDKAVHPTSIMGATKRASEVLCQNFNLHSNTRYITVRFGNVLDSSGSVIPLFRKQLANGGPLTVTHPEISRYFMTIPEASLLILQAATMNQNGGDIFVLDMGNPIKIRYLAEQMIKLSGKNVGQDIQIEYIGLRPGEKLHEELFHQQEDISETEHPKIKRAKTRVFNRDALIEILNEIEISCTMQDDVQLKKLLCQLVPEYQNQKQKYVSDAVC